MVALITVLCTHVSVIGATLRAGQTSPPCQSLQLLNEAVVAVFDGCTGALESLERRGGAGSTRNVISGATTAADRGPFAVWVDAPPPWLATHSLDHGSESIDHVQRSCSGRAGCISLPLNDSGALTPASCKMISHRKNLRSGIIPTLTMVLVPTGRRFPLRITLTASFDGAAGASLSQLVLSLQVRNTGQVPLSLQIAFPIMRGVQLGANGSTDLGVKHLEVGTPGVPAWAGCGSGPTTDSCGGMLGYHVSSMWQQVYAADGSQGLSVIINDTTGHPRMMGRFGDGNSTPVGSGVIYSMTYPGSTVQPNASTTPASALLAVHAGNWRSGAGYYRDWLQRSGAGQRQHNWFLQHTHSKGSFWFPSAAAVAQSKQTGVGMTSFAQMLEYFWGNGKDITGQEDMLEAAMWWEMPEPDAWVEPSFGADGVFRIRQDLGGAEALAAGIKRVQESGRRLQLYVSGDIAHRGSVLFNASWPASRWAQWWGKTGPDQDNGHGGTGYGWNATYMCHALRDWQSVVASAVHRTIRDTNCDGVRLDGLGNFHHEPCFNPSHHHNHPFTIHGLSADIEIMNASRAAMDAAPRGEDTLLSTEGYADLYSLHGGSALISWVGYPAGNEISANRVAMPWYVGNTYGPYESIGRAMMDGWNLARVGTTQEIGWNMLRESFAEVYVNGSVTEIDPIAIDGDAQIGLRLYDAGTFYLLIGASGAVGVDGDYTARGVPGTQDSLDMDDNGILVPPNQQGPVCLEPCTNASMASHWLMRGTQLISANDTTQCMAVTGPHQIQSGGLDLRTCNSSAPLQGFELHTNGQLETTATAAELAVVGVGTRACQCGNGRFVDINAHQGNAGTTCQMSGEGPIWIRVNRTDDTFQLQAASYGIKGMCITHLSELPPAPPPPPPPPTPPPPAPTVVKLPVVVTAGTVAVQTLVDETLASSTTTVGSHVTLPAGFSTTIIPKGAPQVAFLDISPTPLTIVQGQSAVLRVTALAPWQSVPSALVNVTAFGLMVNTTVFRAQPEAWLQVSAAATTTVGAHLLRFYNLGGSMPARRWVHVVARPGIARLSIEANRSPEPVEAPRI